MARNEADFHWPGANQEDTRRFTHFQCREHTTDRGMTSADLSPNLLDLDAGSIQMDPDIKTVHDLFREHRERSVTILSQRFALNRR